MFLVYTGSSCWPRTHDSMYVGRTITRILKAKHKLVKPSFNLQSIRLQTVDQNYRHLSKLVDLHFLNILHMDDIIVEYLKLLRCWRNNSKEPNVSECFKNISNVLIVVKQSYGNNNMDVGCHIILRIHRVKICWKNVSVLAF